MTRLVVDCSVTMGWCFEDEADRYAVDALRAVAADSALVPALWPLEVANVLRGAERRRRVTPADAVRFLELLGELPIDVDGAPSIAAIGILRTLGREYDLSAYDATYLHLALRERLPLATHDVALRRAASAAGVRVFRTG